MDFSESERLGFCGAFVDFWTEYLQGSESTFTEGQLFAIAESHLRGCLQHFEASIARIQRISGVVPPEDQGRFSSMAKGLVSAPDMKTFLELAVQLGKEFPNAVSWLEWWMREEHASMLFESMRRMDPILWESIPKSTNAEEAFHWRLYCAVGKRHDLMSGIRALHKTAVYLESQYAKNISE